MARPIYTPKEQIEKSLYTTGKELMFADTNQEYIGLYHRYPNNSIYSEARYNNYSRELIEYTPAIETKNDSVYYKLTNKRFNNHITPSYHYPKVTAKDYRNANILRYFVTRRNNLSQIIEINADAYSNINGKNEKGIDAGIWQVIVIQWTISGPREDVKRANQRVIKNSIFKNLSTYLTDPLEFYK